MILTSRMYENGNFVMVSANLRAVCYTLNIRDGEYHFKVSERDESHNLVQIATLTGKNFLDAVIQTAEYILQVEKERYENNERRDRPSKDQLSDFG